MALFKNNIVNDYRIVTFDGDYLLLHCAKMEDVKAPFKGKLVATDNGCEITAGNIVLKLTNMIVTIDNKEVEAGAIIGKPIVGNADRNNIAYIGMAIYKAGKLVDPLDYLARMDADEIIEKKKPQPKKEKAVEAKPAIEQED